LATLLQTYLCEVNYVVGTVIGLAFQVWIAAYQNASLANFYCVNSENGGVRRAYDEMFGHFEQMGMDQESIDRMKAQAEQELQKQAQAQQDDGTVDADEESKWTLHDDEDTLD
jgi:hypothetical protein